MVVVRWPSLPLRSIKGSVPFLPALMSAAELGVTFWAPVPQYCGKQKKEQTHSPKAPTLNKNPLFLNQHINY
jgi:hypothetical protein